MPDFPTLRRSEVSSDHQSEKLYLRYGGGQAASFKRVHLKKSTAFVDVFLFEKVFRNFGIEKFCLFLAHVLNRVKTAFPLFVSCSLNTRVFAANIV